MGVEPFPPVFGADDVVELSWGSGALGEAYRALPPVPLINGPPHRSVGGLEMGGPAVPGLLRHATPTLKGPGVG